MGFTVEQECPQCGAPVELEETDHILRCPYCDVKNFLFAPNYFRFVLPHKAHDKDIFYAPYLRFKGNVFFCKNLEVGHRVVDITHLGLALKGLPPSLGVRPQAMKMRFVTPDTGGSFLRFSLKATDILAKAGNLSSTSPPGRIFHRAYIGETLSLIYFPLFLEQDRLFDAVLNQPMAELPGGREALERAMNKNPRWELTFIATLCPQCGWNLDGERDSVVLTCGNCETAWEAREGKFSRVSLLLIPGGGEKTVYLPFWRITARSEGVEVHSFADFIRVTNQPKAVQKQWENQDMSFWSPAFKIRPKVFLNLSKRFTISQEVFETGETILKKNMYPVTLPRSEAAQGMKLTLAASAMNKKKVLPHLPSVKFDIRDSTLVYLPFTETGHDMVQQHIRIGINKNALEFGRQL
jgi:predicted RNA-binding Zn-ribbon protein involved in translation (DUF1610 family)